MDQRVAELETMVTDLRKRIAGQGRGAYAHGTHQIAAYGGSQETILDRLSNAESKLASIRKDLAGKREDIKRLRQEQSANEVLIDSLRADAFELDRQHDQLTAVRQTLAEERRSSTDNAGLLIASELQRIEMETRYFNLVNDLLRLEPDAIQDLLRIQKRLEQDTESLLPDIETH